MSYLRHAHSPMVHPPLKGQPIALASSNAVRNQTNTGHWLDNDPYASLSPQPFRPTSVQSASSAGSAAQFYANDTGFYIPSHASTISYGPSSSGHKDIRRPPSPSRGLPFTGFVDEQFVRPDFVPPPTKIITPAERRAPSETRLTNANLEAHTKKTHAIHIFPRHTPSVATSISMYSQESAPRNHHYPPSPFKEGKATVPPHYHSNHEPDGGSSSGSDLSSNQYSTAVSHTTALTTPQQAIWPLPPVGIPSVLSPYDGGYYPISDTRGTPIQTVKEPKAVRYAPTDEVYTVDPRYISYVVAGPQSASSTNVANVGIRNHVSKLSNPKHKPSASSSSSATPHPSSSAVSVRSLPVASEHKEHYVLKRKQNKSLKDGETQSLYSSKSSTTVSVGKRLLSFFRFRRFLPGGKKSNLSKVDLDSYEVNRYFKKA